MAMTAGGSVILLDTAEVAPRDRGEVIRTAMLSVSVPTDVTLTDSPDETWARMDFWDFGDTNLFASSSSSFRLARSRRHLAMEGVPLVAVAVQTAATAGFEQCGQEYTVRPGELMINDLTAAYDYGWDGDGGRRAFQGFPEQPGLPGDRTRGGDPAGPPVNRPTLEPPRTLIVSAPGATTVPYDSTAELREGAIA